MGKKLLSVIVLCTFMLLVLTGCNSTQGENTQTENLPSTAVQPFESSAQFTYGDFAFEAVVRRDAPGTCIITLTSPKAVEGMKFTYQRGKLTIEYLGT